mmetsp:Transcript_2099/g.7508  ORF Transcript_2099/g.7508 Transcript_2099/m.7508 type:complete len:118 (-) Transcript_2099:623-976(-)
MPGRALLKSKGKGKKGPAMSKLAEDHEWGAMQKLFTGSVHKEVPCRGGRMMPDLGHFDPTRTEYSATVPHDVAAVDVGWATLSRHAKVSFHAEMATQGVGKVNPPPPLNGSWFPPQI